MHEQACCHNEAANHQMPIAVTFWIIPIVSAEECSSLTHNLQQICCSTLSVIFNATATQYTCSLKGIYHPTDQCSEVVIVHAWAFQFPLPACQVTLMSCKPFLLYQQWLDFFRTDLVFFTVLAALVLFIYLLCLCCSAASASLGESMRCYTSPFSLILLPLRTLYPLPVIPHSMTSSQNVRGLYRPSLLTDLSHL